jgi:hypothetical protein
MDKSTEYKILSKSYYQLESALFEVKYYYEHELYNHVLKDEKLLSIPQIQEMQTGFQNTYLELFHFIAKIKIFFDNLKERKLLNKKFSV